jgi:hypothetical protein
MPDADTHSRATGVIAVAVGILTREVIKYLLERPPNASLRSRGVR